MDPPTMAFPILFLLFLSFPFSSATLTLDYYNKTCPDFAKIVRENAFSKQIVVPATAAGVLRIFFHDCFADGCDASIFIASNAYNPHAERDADLNLSLSGDAFEIVSKIKNALELACPGVVSCSDIVAQAARDLVKMVGGPYYNVRLGRKDSLTSAASRADANLPKPAMNMDQIINKFAAKKFTVREMVALTGAHTIGFTHCKEFIHRIFNFSKTSQVDPTLHPKLAEELKRTCKNYTQDPSMAVFNDMRSPSKFDNVYFKNVLRGLGLLTTDYLLSVDPRTRPIVEEYAQEEQAFFRDFANAMEKLSLLGVKTGKDGEVRSRCDQFNRIPV